MKPTTLIIVRHGQTDWNAARRFMGAEDIPLNETGVRQVQQAAEALKSLPIDSILYSPRIRTRQTAQAIGTHHPNATQHMFEPIRERNFGILEGMTYNEANMKYPQIIMGQMWQYPAFAPEGGESINDVRRRAEDALRHINESYRGKHIVLVSHGAYIRIFLSTLLSVPLEHINEYGVANASISIARQTIEGWEVHLINNAAL